jgi:protein tyrosine/serine phosphatase
MHQAASPQISPTPVKSKSRKRLWIIGLSLIGALVGVWFLLTIYVWFNFHEVVPGQVYRSAQPSPAFLESVVKSTGVRSVIKLNSEKESDWSAAEGESAQRLGVEFFHIGIGVTELPNRHELIDLVRAVESAPRPLLIHCKTGADRTGLASVMARMVAGDTFDHAVAEQFKLRYLHVGHVGEAVEDVIAQYRTDRAADGLPTGGWKEFREYVLNEYYPDFYHAGIEPAVTQVTGRPGETVKVEVKVTNRTPRPWPIDSEHPLRLMLGREPTLLAEVPVPALKGDESVTLQVPVTIPALAPGTYQFPFDIAHGTRTWFALRGSSVSPISVTVSDPSLARSDAPQP